VYLTEPVEGLEAWWVFLHSVLDTLILIQRQDW
jgi:hypothetical protein